MQVEHSTSKLTYYYKCCIANLSYGRKCISRQIEVVHARLRLGYHYPWEFAGAVDEDKKKCKVCYESNCHTLYDYYVMECQLLNECRQELAFFRRPS